MLTPRASRLVTFAAALALTACSRTVPVTLPVARATGLDVRADAKVYDDIWDTGCNIFQVTARLALSGRVGGKRPRSAIWVGAAGRALRIERADSRRPFLLTSTEPAQVATLRLPDGRIVASENVEGLVQLATGLPLGGGELQRLLTTCPSREGGGPVSYRPDSNALDLVLGDSPDKTDIIHFARDDAQAAWRLLAMTSNRPLVPFRWRTEFHAPIATVPKTFRLTGLDWTGQPSGELDVLVTVDHVQVGPMIEPHLFAPATASDKSMTLEELRTSGVKLPLIVD